jgi:hypothetical protein
VASAGAFRALASGACRWISAGPSGTLSLKWLKTNMPSGAIASGAVFTSQTWR